MSIKKLLFDQYDQKDVFNYEIELDNVKATFGECGAAIIKYSVKDKFGTFRDVVLGCVLYSMLFLTYLALPILLATRPTTAPKPGSLFK